MNLDYVHALEKHTYIAGKQLSDLNFEKYMHPQNVCNLTKHNHALNSRQRLQINTANHS